MTTNKKRNLALAIAILVGVASAILHLKQSGCFTGCALETTFPHHHDVYNIAHHSQDIAHGTSPLAFPDPPMRYLPLAAIMLALSPLNIDPVQLTVGFSIVAEFIVLPVVFYATVRTWTDHETATYAVAAMAALFLVVPPWPKQTMFEIGWHMYAYAMLPFLLALRNVPGRNYRRVGVWLGVTALTQIMMAGVGAFIVFLTLARTRDGRGLGVAAGVSMLLSTPTLAISLLHENAGWVSRAVRRTNLDQDFAGLVNVKEFAFLGVLLAGTVAAVVGWRRLPAQTRAAVQEVPAAVLFSTGVLTVLTAFAVVLDASWYQSLFGYMWKYVVFTAAGILVSMARTIDWSATRRVLIGGS